jgi:hypothetical protein
MGEAINGEVSHVEEVQADDLKAFDLVIVGSLTHGGFPTEGIHELVKTPAVFENLDVAAFDPRTKRTIFGYAAPKIAQNLEKNGGYLLTPPEGFFVLGKKGPLKEGELTRAAKWTKRMVS